METQLAEARRREDVGAGSSLDDDTVDQLVAEFNAIETKLSGTGGGDLGIALRVKVNKKDEKKLAGRKREILEMFGGNEKSFHAARAKSAETASLARKIRANASEMSKRWDDALRWLTAKGFVVPDQGQPSGHRLLPRGQACAAFADGHPLVVGTVIAEGYLEALSFGEVRRERESWPKPTC